MENNNRLDFNNRPNGQELTCPEINNTDNTLAIRQGVDAYMKIRADGDPRGLWLESTYDSTVFFLRTISNLMDPNYTWEISSSTKVGVGLAEPFKFEDEEFDETTTYSLTTTKIDGVRESDDITFRSHWLNNDAINAMKEAGFLGEQSSESSGGTQPLSDLDRRIELARILITYQLSMVDPASEFKNRYVVPQSVEKQFAILSKTVDIAKKIDLKQESDRLKTSFRERIGELRNWYQQIRDGSNYASYENPLFYRGDEDQEFLRDSFNDVNALFLKHLRDWGIDQVGSLEVDKLTKENIKGIMKTYDYAQGVLRESETRDEYKFGDPPLKIGERKMAKFLMEGQTLAMSILSRFG